MNFFFFGKRNNKKNRTKQNGSRPAIMILRFGPNGHRFRYYLHIYVCADDNEIFFFRRKHFVPFMHKYLLAVGQFAMFTIDK